MSIKMIMNYDEFLYWVEYQETEKGSFMVVYEDDPDKPILVKRIEKRLLKNWRDLRVKAKAELDLMKRGDRR